MNSLEIVYLEWRRQGDCCSRWIAVRLFLRRVVQRVNKPSVYFAFVQLNKRRIQENKVSGCSSDSYVFCRRRTSDVSCSFMLSMMSVSLGAASVETPWDFSDQFSLCLSYSGSLLRDSLFSTATWEWQTTTSRLDPSPIPHTSADPSRNHSPILYEFSTISIQMKWLLRISYKTIVQ